MQFSEASPSSITSSATITSTQAPVDRSATPAPTSIVQDAALLLIPICFVAVWAAVVCVIADTWKLNRKDMKTSKDIAQLPCKKCQFFSNNPYVKCAVNPCVAMTTAANECQDYRPRDRRPPTAGRKS